MDEFNNARATLRDMDPRNRELESLTAPGSVPSRTDIDRINQEISRVRAIDPASYQNATIEQARNRIPNSWLASPARTGADTGTVYRNPNRLGEQIRIMSGNPKDPDLLKRSPYIRISTSGRKSPPISLKGK